MNKVKKSMDKKFLMGVIAAIIVALLFKERGMYLAIGYLLGFASGSLLLANDIRIFNKDQGLRVSTNFLIKMLFFLLVSIVTYKIDYWVFLGAIVTLLAYRRIAMHYIQKELIIEEKNGIRK